MSLLILKRIKGEFKGDRRREKRKRGDGRWRRLGGEEKANGVSKGERVSGATPLLSPFMCEDSSIIICALI